MGRGSRSGVEDTCWPRERKGNMGLGLDKH